MSDQPFVSCVMPTTAARRWCIPWAIEYFKRQSYERSELVIVSDGESLHRDIEELGDGGARIRHVHIDHRPLGAKYNACVHYARYDWVALWGDDDWHAPWRLEYTMRELQKKPWKQIAGLRKMLFHRMGTDRTFMYERPGDDPYFLGGSLVFHKTYWSRHKFDGEAARRADASFTNDMSPEEYAAIACVLDEYMFYVAMNHADNTGRDGEADPSGDGWSRWGADLRQLIDKSERYV